MDAETAVPKLVVFDLDYTMWNPEMYQLYGAPFEKRGGKVYDRSGTEVKLFRDVRSILRRIRTSEEFSSTKIASASRTEYPEWAYEVMSLMPVDDNLTMADVFEFNEIYPGTKTAHFRRLHQDSQIAFKDMVFFDDWNGNCRDVARLGVTTMECPQGMTMKVFDACLQKFQAAVNSKVPKS
eukprot:CAMPEP_0113940962 /NCGR_PEP_ID=MMETSP1339-20121228/6981_1 /TAXON_ID=94617 /ORGANISM="Fibrocapsa japonica" /LENGTH=180 /DNA_ID=CAMNT_0000944963 /DNA_START=175 /DNA_END=717 /DNA_ORIENTATION=- /assembly_acc=CAM_ASM_000762